MLLRFVVADDQKVLFVFDVVEQDVAHLVELATWARCGWNRDRRWLV